MSEAEAREILALMRAGKRFSTRFQEEGWGLEAAEHGAFRLWSYRYEPDGTEERSDDRIGEDAAIARLRLYAFARITAGLR